MHSTLHAKARDATLFLAFSIQPALSRTVLFFRSQVLLCRDREVQVWFWHMVRRCLSDSSLPLFLFLHTCWPPVLLTKWQPPYPLQTHPDLSAGAVGTDYSNKETASVSLKPSNFAIKRLPDYLVAEHQIPLHSDGQRPVTSTNPWHLITEVCFCAKLLLWGGGGLCLRPTDFCLNTEYVVGVLFFVFFSL